MPNIPDGQKGMTTRATNEVKTMKVLYTHPGHLVIDGRKRPSPREQSPNPNKGSSGWLERLRKVREASSPEVAKVASMSKSDVKDFASTKHKGLPEKKVKKESFEAGVQKARRDYRSGTLLTFKQFMSKLTDILDEWEK